MGLTPILYGQSDFLMKDIVPVELGTTQDQIYTYLKTGKEGKEAMILLHGLGTDAKSFLKLMPALKNDFSVYAFNFPKYLDRDGKQDVGIKNYAEDLIDFMDLADIDKAHIVGHSMGGQIAMTVALHNPERMSSLILLAPAGLEKFSQQDRDWFSAVLTKDLYLNMSDENIKKNFDVNFYGGKLPSDAQFLLEERMELKQSGLLYSRYVDYILASVQSMLDESVADDLPNLSVPTLTLFGESDFLIPNKFIHPKMTTEEVANISKNIPDSKLSMIAEAGHFVMWDKSEEVAQEIRTFVENLK